MADPTDPADDPRDGTWKTLQTATAGGTGLNIVFIGDAYTSDLIDNGTYDSDMRRAMNHFFDVEPYTSLRNMFNCYQVYAVSQDGNYNSGSSTALKCKFTGGMAIMGDEDRILKYATDISELTGTSGAKVSMVVDGQIYYRPYRFNGGLLVVVVLNTDRVGGSTAMYTSGVSIAFCPLSVKDKRFAEIIHHEACGHGFGFLADEYEGNGTVTSSSLNQLKRYQNYGMYPNVDNTDDPDSIIWSKFLKDSRYSPYVGIFEGGFLYSKGIWRPTEASIMRYNIGGFNAPSREAIYRRAMELNKGASYVYDFEEFAAFDAKARAASEAQTRSAVETVPPYDFVQFAEPVIRER